MGFIIFFIIYIFSLFILVICFYVEFLVEGIGGRVVLDVRVFGLGGKGGLNSFGLVGDFFFIKRVVWLDRCFFLLGF